MGLFRLTVFCCFVVLVNCECKNKERHLYYKELQCKPMITDDPNCPSSYDCSHLAQRPEDKCRYNGKDYNKGEILERSVFTDSPCTAHCSCWENYENKTVLTCVPSECPELFQPPLGENCVRQYASLNDCCSSKTFCGNEKSATTTCSYKGKTYFEGQKIFPEDQPCKECICGPGFDETLSEPFCKTIKCQYELHYSEEILQGCAPKFYKELSCCPIEWINPKEVQYKVVPGPGSDGSSNTNEKCHFGDSELNINDELVLENNPNTVCKCTIPPHVFCVEKEYKE